MGPAYYDTRTLEPSKSIGFLIKRCGVLMSQLAEREFEAHGMSFTQWLVLIRLRWCESLTATQLSEDMGHDLGALTRVVDSLERAGLVRRQRSRRDRRAVEIAITPRGRRVAGRTLPFIANLLNRLVEPFARQEIEALIALLQRLLARLEFFLTEGARRPARATASPARLHPAIRVKPAVQRRIRGKIRGGTS
ncbi:MAG: winged helix-turn-helix transcriptional regulator [Nevskia sp.]|nr:winged helix-turn-helix transcriptional regulator [Nevskia sp.]